MTGATHPATAKRACRLPHVPVRRRPSDAHVRPVEAGRVRQPTRHREVAHQRDVGGAVHDRPRRDLGRRLNDAAGAKSAAWPGRDVLGAGARVVSCRGDSRRCADTVRVSVREVVARQHVLRVGAGRLVQARRVHEDTLTAVRGNVPEDHPAHTRVPRELSKTLAALGDIEGSLELLDQILRATQRKYGARSREVVKVLRQQADLLLGEGRFDEALMLANKVSELDRELNQWIRQYVADQDNPPPAVRSKRPLREAEIIVSEEEGSPGWFRVEIKVRPHFKYMGSSFTLSLAGKLDKS